MHTESSFNSPSAVQTGAEENASFEDAYRHYEFAPLVAAAIAAAEWLTRKRQRSAIRRAAPADVLKGTEAGSTEPNRAAIPCPQGAIDG